MTAYKIISIFIWIIALLMTFGSLIAALLCKAIHKRYLPFSTRKTTSKNKIAYPMWRQDRQCPYEHLLT